MSMPALVIKGTDFVLTGRMWTERRHIVKSIEMRGGTVSSRFKKGSVLVIASSRLIRRDDKWHTRGTATEKAESAIEKGALVYHEQMLESALHSFMGRALATRTSVVPVSLNRQEPEWNAEMQAELDANIAETSKLFESF